MASRKSFLGRILRHASFGHVGSILLALGALGVLVGVVGLVYEASHRPSITTKHEKAYWDEQEQGHWMILCSGAVLFGLACAYALGGAAYRDKFRDRTRNPHICRCCGNPIRGNTSGRCPECGQAFIPIDPFAVAPRIAEDTADPSLNRDHCKVIDSNQPYLL